VANPGRISIIIPVLNEESHIERCVASAWAAGCDEVLVADGGSTDHTVEKVSALACRLIHSDAGRARQQNAAARAATGDVLLFLHADNRLEPGACDQVRRSVDREGTVCGAFRQHIEAPGIGFRLLEWGNACRVRWLGLPYGDQAIFVERAAFERVGGFPAVRLLEDLLLMRQLRRIGWPRLLPGPVHVSDRRWRRQGVIRQTLRNWFLLAAHRCGVPPDQLARHYHRHDQ
jgi:rSAM/selenodomain-associated transferase 2